MADAIILFTYPGSVAVRRGLFSLCAQAGDSSQGAVPEEATNFFCARRCEERYRR